MSGIAASIPADRCCAVGGLRLHQGPDSAAPFLVSSTIPVASAHRTKTIVGMKITPKKSIKSAA